MKNFFRNYSHSLHPFLFALFPILYLFASNIKEVAFTDILTSALILFVFTVLLYIVFWVVVRNIQKAAIITSLFLISFFIYGTLLTVRNEFGLRFRYLFSAWVLVFFTGAVIIWKYRKDMRIAVNTCNVIASFLVFMSLSSIAYSEVRFLMNTRRVKSPEVAKNINTENQFVLPDIYYILPDAHASILELKTYFDYDDAEFINYLKNTGFYVVPRSRTNYHMTDLVLSSLLNLNYLNDLGARSESSLEGLNEEVLIQEHMVGRFLKSQGYTYIHAGTGWNLTHKNRFADININKGYIPEFPMILYRSVTETLKLLGLEIELVDVRREQWNRILYQFDEVARIPSMKEPTFAFIHLSVPHHPFVFNQDGSYHDGEPPYISREEYKDYRGDYLNQLIFVDKKLEELVDILLSQSEVPPIIVIQSDHGSSLLADTKLESNQHWRTRLKNFSAYYLPSLPENPRFRKDVLPYESISPVNTFRLIFDRYFGTNYGFLPDKSYITRESRATDITELINEDYRVYYAR